MAVVITTKMQSLQSMPAQKTFGNPASVIIATSDFSKTNNSFLGHVPVSRPSCRGRSSCSRRFTLWRPRCRPRRSCGSIPRSSRPRWCLLLHEVREDLLHASRTWGPRQVLVIANVNNILLNAYSSKDIHYTMCKVTSNILTSNSIENCKRLFVVDIFLGLRNHRKVQVKEWTYRFKQVNFLITVKQSYP